jgi:uncharacterized low-complexity protein
VRPLGSARVAGVLRLAALLAICGCNGAFGDSVHEEFHQTIAAGAAPFVRVDNVAGTIRIEGWSKPFVDVVATKYGHDAQELRNIAIRLQKEEGGVSVVTSYTGDMHAGGVRYRISVPADASLQIENVAGTVDIIAGVGGNIVVKTQAGAITVNAGRVAGDRSIDLRATTGAITLSIAPGSSARVDVSSTVGEIASDVAGVSAQRENIVGSRGGGTIGAGSAQILMSTATGAIALHER